jgi:hypothetical protein
MRSKLGVILVVVIGVLAAAASACGSGGQSEPGTLTFARVCMGEGAEHDVYYGSAADGEGPFPVMIFRRAGAGEPWYRLKRNDLGTDFPSEWLPTEAAQTELAVCLTAVEREVVSECDYTATDDEGGEVELVIQICNTTYEAVLRDARTAEEYDSTTFQTQTDEECPETTFETWDQDVRVIDSNPAAGLVPFLEPWVVK